MTIPLSESITALVGSNGTGKTALLIALTRMFGPSQVLRTIKRSDFYNQLGGKPTECSANELAIEVVFTFPELNRSQGDDYAIPPTFKHMIVQKPEGNPFCRMRLEANWTDDGTTDGSVEQSLFWVLTGHDAGEVDGDNDKHRVSPQDRALIQVNYIPATRNPAREFRNAARGRVGRLMRAISWDDKTRASVEHSAEQISDTLSNEKSVILISDLLKARWDELRNGEAARADLAFSSAQFNDIVRDVTVLFDHPYAGEGSDFATLSEGQQSLFYLALVAAVFDVEFKLTSQPSRMATANTSSPASETYPEKPESVESLSIAIDTRQLGIPALTVFALEEPENHLAPHYLPRIGELLRTMTRTDRAQALFASHSPAVLRRVPPRAVRHLRINSSTSSSIVRSVKLPPQSHEANKYVREAVTAYPELYFAKFVILAEGASEELAIPRIAAAHGLDIDRSFVSVVPLGGRHVNHFWKLLDDLDIPHVTLVDLDLGRSTGGWSRIQYICRQLIQIGTESSALLEFEHNGDEFSISTSELDDLHQTSIRELDMLIAWLAHLEAFGVYFSKPLDFDYMMLKRLPEAYQATADGSGPLIPDPNSDAYEKYMTTTISSVVSTDETAIALYKNAKNGLAELLAWYRYLFLHRSKPDTHFRALLEVSNSELRKHTSPSLKRLIDVCRLGLAT